MAARAPEKGGTSRLERWLPARALAATLYGTVLVTAVLVAISESDYAPEEMISAIFVTTLVFTLAHAWALALEQSAQDRRTLTAAEFGRSLTRQWPLVEAAIPAAIALALAWAGVYSTETGVTVAISFNIAQLFVWGAALRSLTGGGPLRVLLSGLFTALFGVVLVVLKVLVH